MSAIDDGLEPVLGREVRELSIEEQEPGPGVFERRKPTSPADSRVLIATSTPPAAGNSEVGLEQGGDVRGKDRDPLAAAEPAPAERRGQSP